MDKSHKKYYQFKNTHKIFSLSNLTVKEKVSTNNIVNKILDFEFTKFQEKNLMEDLMKNYCEKCKYLCNNPNFKGICCNCNNITYGCSYCEQRHEENIF